MRVDGDTVLVRNLRNFRWLDHERSEERSEERRFALGALHSLDVLAVYRIGEAITQVISSFGFGPERLAVSIEIRSEAWEAPGALAGFLRRRPGAGSTMGRSRRSTRPTSGRGSVTTCQGRLATSQNGRVRKVLAIVDKAGTQP